MSKTLPLLAAYHHSVTTLTTVGYGDRVPSTDVEKVPFGPGGVTVFNSIALIHPGCDQLVSILCELAGSVIFGIIAGNLSAIAMSESMTKRAIARTCPFGPGGLTVFNSIALIHPGCNQASPPSSTS